MNKIVSVDDEEVDNGGAIALKGFNYQNAVASLIAILNYDKDMLKDDFIRKDTEEYTFNEQEAINDIKRYLSFYLNKNVFILYINFNIIFCFYKKQKIRQSIILLS